MCGPNRLKNARLGSFLILGVIGAATVITVSAMTSTDSRRQVVPKSKVDQRKLAALASPNRGKHQAKAGAAVHVETQLVLERSNPEKGIWVLGGKIEGLEPLSRVRYEWRLPKDVRVIAGSLAGELPVLSPDSPGRLDLTVETPVDRPELPAVLTVQVESRGVVTGNASAVRLETEDSQAHARNWLYREGALAQQEEIVPEDHDHGSIRRQSQSLKARSLTVTQSPHKKIRIMH